MIDASLIRQLSEGIIVLRTECGIQMWTLAKARKARACAVCEEDIKPGDQVFRPLTNLGNRYWRIHPHCVKTLTTEL